MIHDITATRWAHACVLAIERALGRPFSGEDAAKVQMALLNPPWLPIETAPKDGTEILGWRDDCGSFMARWTCPEEFLASDELEGLDEENAQTPDWFYADFVSGGRLDGSEAPTHWLPFPPPPQEQA